MKVHFEIHLDISTVILKYIQELNESPRISQNIPTLYRPIYLFNLLLFHLHFNITLQYISWKPFKQTIALAWENVWQQQNCLKIFFFFLCNFNLHISSEITQCKHIYMYVCMYIHNIYICIHIYIYIYTHIYNVYMYTQT